MKATAGNGGGGASKTRSGGGTETITRTKEMKTKAINDQLIVLRAAVYNDDGSDRDVTTGIAPIFLQWKNKAKDVHVNFEFFPKLRKKDYEYCFNITKAHMEEIYDQSGMGWYDDDLEFKLKENGTRFLIARNEDSGKPIGFVHFRFTVQGEVLDQMVGEACIYVWDIHVDDAYQRQGLGKHMLTLIELIAGRTKMKHVCVPVQKAATTANAWIGKSKGYSHDDFLSKQLGFSADSEGFEVFTRSFGQRAINTRPITAPVAAPTPAPTVKSSSDPKDSNPKITSAEEEEEDEEDEEDEEEEETSKAPSLVFNFKAPPAQQASPTSVAADAGSDLSADVTDGIDRLVVS